MTEEIKLMTRGEGGRDFVWFSPKIDENWREKYSAAFFKNDSQINLFADIENGCYRIYFDKIMRPWEIVRSSIKTVPYVVLMASGKCGSDSAKAFYKILTNYFFGNNQQVEKLFAEIIPKDFIEEVYDNARTPEVEAQISEKLEAIVSNLSDIAVPETKKLEDNKYIFDNYEKNKNAFFSELKRITVLSNKKEYISLVLTGKGIGKFLDNEFDCKPFTSGMCLTTSTIEGGNPIEKAIRTIVSIELSSCPVKTTYKQGEKFVAGGCVIRITYSNGTTETKAVTDDEISGFDPQKVGTQKLVVTYEGCTTSFEVTVTDPFDTVGTTTIQNAPKGNNTKNPETEENDSSLSTILSRIKSDQSFRKLLIITSVIILALLFMVRSCVKKSGNGSEKNSPEQKEQPSSPQSPDSSKKSTTDTLEIKADSCKKNTKDTLK